MKDLRISDLMIEAESIKMEAKTPGFADLNTYMFHNESNLCYKLVDFSRKRLSIINTVQCLTKKAILEFIENGGNCVGF